MLHAVLTATRSGIDVRILFLNYESTLIASDAVSLATLALFFDGACAYATSGFNPIGRVGETLMSLARLAAAL